MTPYIGFIIFVFMGIGGLVWCIRIMKNPRRESTRVEYH